MIQVTPRIPSNLSGLRVGVYGLGVSGAAAARWLEALGARVALFDDRDPDPARLEALGLAGMGEVRRPADLDGLAALVVSPGVPPDAPGRTRARELGVPVLGELALAARDLDGILTVVTGSHGKSTVTGLIAAMLRARGETAAACGNLGRPLTDVRLAGDVPRELVVEASSFQLHDAPDLVADRAVFTAYAPNHLDWHPDEEHYREAKLRLLDAMRPGARVAYLPGFPGLEERLATRRLTGVVVGPEGPFGYDEGAAGEVRTPAGVAALADGFPPGVAALSPAFALAAAAVEATPDEVLAAAREYEPLPHRMQDLGVVDGVRWIDDSKATTPAAAAYALGRALAGGAPVVVILGGKDKGLDFGAFRDVFARAHARVATGAAAGRIVNDLAGLDVERVEDFEEAVDRAGEVAPCGGVVLLAPGCSSFDRFRSFEERGTCFQQSVASRTT